MNNDQSYLNIYDIADGKKDKCKRPRPNETQPNAERIERKNND